VIGFNLGEYLFREPLKVLERAKREAQGRKFGSKGTAVEFNGRQFMVAPRGARGYDYVLRNDDLSLLLASTPRGGEYYPEAYCTFRAPFLWRRGDAAAYDTVSEWLSCFANVTGNLVSRADLCADLVMPLPDLDTRREVAGRARARHEWEGAAHGDGSVRTGYSLGSGALQGRLYDKTHEILLKGDDAQFRTLWAQHGWDGQASVTRLEFQYRREVLRQYGASTYEQLQGVKADMWQHSTNDWVRVVGDGSANGKRHRQTQGFWSEFQSCADLFGEASGALRTHSPAASFGELVAQGTGCLASAWARIAVAQGEDYATWLICDAVGVSGLTEQFLVKARLRLAEHGRMN